MAAERGADGGDGTALRVLVCDPHPLIRTALRIEFRTGRTVEAVADFDTAAAALRWYAPGRADAALVSLAPRWSRHDGLALVAGLRDRDDGLACVVYAEAPSGAGLQAAIDVGAAGYISARSDPGEIAAALRRAVAGEQTFDTAAASELITAATRPGPDVATLTEREVEIVALFALGLTNDAIAGRLGISPATVKTLASRARAKLGAPDRASAVAEAMRRRLIA